MLKRGVKRPALLYQLSSRGFYNYPLSQFLLFSLRFRHREKKECTHRFIVFGWLQIKARCKRWLNCGHSKTFATSKKVVQPRTQGWQAHILGDESVVMGCRAQQLGRTAEEKRQENKVEGPSRPDHFPTFHPKYFRPMFGFCLHG